MDPTHLPQENLEVSDIIYQIETALRELIIETLSNIEGQKWYKKLPGEILQKYREGREYEKKIHWTQFVQHNPIYYVDFPDLKKIIENNNYWKKAFEPIFSRKEILTSTLSEIEPIRNKIAHNRKATSNDIMIAKSALNKLSSSIGTTYFNTLVNRCTLASNIYEELSKLQIESMSFLHICNTYGSLDKLEVWTSIHNEWWFDESYIGEKIDKIEAFFELAEEYLSLPRFRGTGHIIEEWVNNKKLEAKYIEAQTQFKLILVNT